MSSRGLARHGKKRDANEKEIISTWEEMGAYVESISGKGSPDTLVHFDGALLRCEVKGAKRGLTPAQVESFTKAYDARVFTYIIRTSDDARALLKRELLPWGPDDGALAGAARKERPFRPGTDRARTLAESCKREGCITSAVPGTKPPRCAAHVAEETFASAPCPACKIDPQNPCKHDGEEKGVALGLVPPRRLNQRPVDNLMAKRQRRSRSGS